MFFLISNLLHGAHRQTMVYDNPNYMKNRKRKERKRKEKKRRKLTSVLL